MFFRILLSLSTFVFLTSCASNTRSLSVPSNEEEISYTPVKPEEWVLPNGLKVVYVEDKELPIVSGSLHIPRGTLWSKNDDSDLIAAMGYLMRQGGTKKLAPDELDFKLEKLAASVESEYSGEMGSVGFSSLTSDFEEVFSVFSEVVLEPRYAESRLDLWKGQMLEGIRRRVDDPNTIAGIAFKKLVYGDTVFGKTSGSAKVNSITRDDLIKIHKEFVVPQGAVLAVIGDIKREVLAQAVEKYFSQWKPAPLAKDRDPVFKYDLTPGIYFIEQPLEQATIYMGQQGPARLPPEYTAIEAFNNIFGSGDFGARLFSKIRTELGLAYALYGSIINSYLVGQNIIILQTKSESASEAVIETIKILNDMREEEATSEELNRSKQATKNSFIFKIDTPEEALKRFVLLHLLKYPEDYDATYLDKVDRLKLSDIKDVANKYWDLDKLVIVVVGNKKAYNKFQSDLQNNPGSFRNAKIKLCKFKETLESCN